MPILDFSDILIKHLFYDRFQSHKMQRIFVTFQQQNQKSH